MLRPVVCSIDNAVASWIAFITSAWEYVPPGSFCSSEELVLAAGTKSIVVEMELVCTADTSGSKTASENEKLRGCSWNIFRANSIAVSSLVPVVIWLPSASVSVVVLVAVVPRVDAVLVEVVVVVV